MSCINGGYINAGGIFMKAPCGKCIICKVKRMNQWHWRLLQEARLNPPALFITLTYDDNNLVWAGKKATVNYDDVKKFWKRIRKKVDYKFKYYAVSEYGDISERPHYHALTFGLKPEDANLWHLGFSYIDEVNDNTIRYVLGYMKKQGYNDWNNKMLVETINEANVIIEDYENENYNFTKDDYKWAKNFIFENSRDIERSYMSKGIGRGYINEETINYHRSKLDTRVSLPHGYTTTLPRIFKDEIFTGEWEEKLWWKIFERVNKIDYFDGKLKAKQEIKLKRMKEKYENYRKNKRI